jgi:hypothetical protein
MRLAAVVALPLPAAVPVVPQVAVQVVRLPLEAARVVPAVVAQALRKPGRPVVPAVFPHRRLCMLPVLLPAVVVRGFRMPDS